MSTSRDIYTDGGCTGNPGPGGWAAILLDGENVKRLSGGSKATTNNRMELTAVIEALKEALELGWSNVAIHTDSQYVQKGISQWIQGWIKKGWKTASGTPVKNKDLWLELLGLDQRVSVQWTWVKGHAGNQWNEECDALVAQERNRFAQ